MQYQYSGDPTYYVDKVFNYNDYLVGLRAIYAACLYYGYGVEQDKKQAVSIWLGTSTAAKTDDMVKAAESERDKKKARELYEIASLLGSSDATKSLALLCMNGEGVDKDEKGASELLERSAEIEEERLKKEEERIHHWRRKGKKKSLKEREREKTDEQMHEIKKRIKTCSTH